MKDLLTGLVYGRVATWRTQLLLDLLDDLKQFTVQCVILPTLRGGLARIGDWSDPTHCTNSTSQQQVAAAGQQTDSHL